MVQHHALGPSCRSAGVDEVSQVVGCDVGLDILAGVSLQQLLHINRLVGFDGVQAVGRGDDVSRFAVLKDESDAVGRIIGVARDIGGSSLEHAEQCEHQSAGARQQQCHTVALSHTALAQRRCNAIGGPVHLGIGVLGIGRHQCLVVGLRLGKVVDALMHQSKGCLAGGRLAQLAQLLLLPLTDD